MYFPKGGGVQKEDFTRSAIPPWWEGMSLFFFFYKHVTILPVYEFNKSI